MPARRTFRGKRKNRRRGRNKKVFGYGKHLQKENNLLFTATRLMKSLKLPLPQRWRTCLNINFVGVIPMGYFDANGHGALSVKLNSLFHPFDGSNSGFSTLTLSFGASTALTYANLAPMGYSDFMGSSGIHQYAYSRVLASSITVTVMPTAAVDTITVCIAPQLGTAGTTFGAAVLMGAAPFSTNAKLCYGNNTGKDNTLKNYCSLAQFMGVPPSSILDEDNYRAIHGADPTNLVNWIIMLDQNNKTDSANPTNINLKVRYYVEFQQSTQAGFSDQ